MERGFPLMRSKWVHRTWAHQRGTQGQGTKLAYGPPHLPRGNQANVASTTTTKDRGILRAPLNPKEDVEVPGTPLGSPPGTNLHTCEEDELASPGWKLPEDLGAKKMEAPWGAGTEKLSVLVRPHGKFGRPHLTPLRKILGREEATSSPKKNPEGFSHQNPSGPKGAPVVSLSL